MAAIAPELKKALGLYSKKKYSDLISFLSSKVFMFRQDPLFFRLLGSACLQTGDLGGASSYYQRVLSIEPLDIQATTVMGIISLLRRDTQKALQYWLDALEREPDNRHLKKFIALCRKLLSGDILSEADKKWLMAKAHPKQVSSLVLKRRLKVILLGMGTIALGLGVFAIVQNLLVDRAYQSERIGFEPLAAIPDSAFSQFDDQVSGQAYSAQELQDYRMEALELFDLGRDNELRILFNRLKRSNLNPDLKFIIENLEPLLKYPRLGQDFFSPSFIDVMSDTPLYQAVAVRWRGRAVNVVVGDSIIQLDFLVGEDVEQVVEGVVPASLQFAHRFNPSIDYEILAVVRVADDRSISLEIKQLRQILR